MRIASAKATTQEEVKASACTLGKSENLCPINFAPVSDGEQVKNSLGTIEVLDPPIVAHAKAVSNDSLHAMM